MTIALIVAYLIVGAIDLVLILLHSGRGGGISDMFGGGIGASAAGSTSVERNLDRMTIFFSLLFVFLTILLVFQLGE